MTETDPPARSPSGWLYLAFAVFFAAVGVGDLLGPDPSWVDVVWEWAFATANVLFFWLHHGAPYGARYVAYALSAVGLVAGLLDVTGVIG